MIYFNRVLEKTGMTLDPTNWRRLILSSLILSSKVRCSQVNGNERKELIKEKQKKKSKKKTKVWEDAAVWNVDFIDLFPSLSVKDLNRLGKAFFFHFLFFSFFHFFIFSFFLFFRFFIFFLFYLFATESQMLNILEFSVSIKSREYVSMYFDLRRKTPERSEFVKPLDDSGIQKLEVKQKNFLKKKKTKKTKKILFIHSTHSKKQKNNRFVPAITKASQRKRNFSTVILIPI